MTNENVKVTDLIGKSISNGGNAKYTINSIEGDKVSVTFQMGDSEGKPMTMGVAQVEKLLQGGWTVQGSEECRVKSEKFATAQEDSKAEEPKAKTVKMTSEREQSGTRSGSAERESSRPQGKMEPEPKPKAEKPKVTLKRKQPQTEEPKPQAEQPQARFAD
jgi:spore cortex formation protein SpoVR/YcgB (stage V sporulation)